MKIIINVLPTLKGGRVLNEVVFMKVRMLMCHGNISHLNFILYIIKFSVCTKYENTKQDMFVYITYSLLCKNILCWKETKYGTD